MDNKCQRESSAQFSPKPTNGCVFHLACSIHAVEWATLLYVQNTVNSYKEVDLHRVCALNLIAAAAQKTSIHSPQLIPLRSLITNRRRSSGWSQPPLITMCTVSASHGTLGPSPRSTISFFLVAKQYKCETITTPTWISSKRRHGAQVICFNDHPLQVDGEGTM